MKYGKNICLNENLGHLVKLRKYFVGTLEATFIAKLHRKLVIILVLGGSVMVWAGIHAHHDEKTDLVIVPGNLTAQRYCDGIIDPVIVPFWQHHNVGIFQHDNARPHTARHTQNILRIHNVNVLQWPARSPDLSPIERLWDHLGRQMSERHDVNNIRDLERALQAKWIRIPLQVIRKLICNMRRRCLAVLAANGGHTRY